MYTTPFSCNTFESLSLILLAWFEQIETQKRWLFHNGDEFRWIRNGKNLGRMQFVPDDGWKWYQGTFSWSLIMSHNKWLFIMTHNNYSLLWLIHGSKLENWKNASKFSATVDGSDFTFDNIITLTSITFDFECRYRNDSLKYSYLMAHNLWVTKMSGNFQVE